MSDCNGSCTNGCIGNCTSQCEGCGQTCMLKGSACAGICSSGCTNESAGSNELCGACGYNCGGQCARTCISCAHNCIGGCINGCNTCTGCSSSCGVSCGGCSDVCTGCRDTCKNSCTGCSNTCQGGCGTTCQNACGNCSHGCAVVANKEAYDYIKLGMKKLLTGKDARMLRDLFMEEIYRRLKNPFHKYVTTTTSSNIEILSEDNEHYSANTIKEIKYVVVNKIQLSSTQYNFNSVNNIITIPGISAGSKVAISYITTDENDTMLILYQTGKMLIDNNNLSNIKVSSNTNDSINRNNIIKQKVADEYRKVAIALYDEMIANDPNENGSSWADE